MWGLAEFLAVRRMKANSNHNPWRDRGRRQNFVGDLVGSFAEVCLYQHLREIPNAREYVEQTAALLRNLEGGVATAGADLICSPGVGLDVKSSDCAAHKQLFTVTRDKHQSLWGSVSHYYCVLAPPYAKEVIICNLVPYPDVETWPCFDLGYGDVSYNIPFDQFVERYVGYPVDREDLRGNFYERGEIEKATKRVEETHGDG